MAEFAAALRSSLKKTNYARLNRLTVDGGWLALKQVFDGFHPPANLQISLNNKITTLQKLQRERRLNRKQWDLLFPPGGAVPDSTNFDITLLFVLLRNICGLYPPRTGSWDSKPPASDTSLEADLARIKWFRNELAHKTSTGVEEADFSSYWVELSGTLARLGFDQSEIDRLKSAPIDEDQYQDVLSDWKREEEQIKDQLAVIIQNQNKAMFSKEELIDRDIKCSENDADLLGKGCKGTKVYSGTLVSSGKSIAVKKMFNGIFDLREAKRLKNLIHPNIIRCFAVEIKGDFIYLALELCQKTLRRCMEENDFGRQGSGVTRLGCLNDVAAAVVFLHERKICHRDIKPDNILLSMATPQHFLLADFNTARQTGANESASTQLGAVVGTYGYIAPEAFNPSEKLNVRMDIFSLGCVFYYILTDKGHPFGSVEQPKQCQATINKCEVPLITEGDFLECSWTKPVIGDMVSFRSAQRPTAERVMKALKEQKYSRKLSAGVGDKSTGDLPIKAKPADNQKPCPKRPLTVLSVANEGSPKKKKRQPKQKPEPKPSEPNPEKGSYHIGIVGFLTRKVTKCYGCKSAFRIRGKPRLPPEDLVVVTRGKREFWDRNLRGKRTSDKVTKIYFHINQKCINEHDSEFLLDQVHVPDDLKGYLKQEHFDFLRRSGILT